MHQKKGQKYYHLKKINELLGHSTNIFKKSNFDQCIDIANALFSAGKCSAVDKFCCAEF